MKSLRQMMVFMSPVIGQFCPDHVIGHQDLRVAAAGRLLFYCDFQSMYCLLEFVSFV